ncbi:MAG: alpha/beta hydrolase [Candidatus Kapaibacterium sp.]
MNIFKQSHFKDIPTDKQWFERWVHSLETANRRTYQRFTVNTSLGMTHVWGLHTDLNTKDTLVIFPGARTTSLFWDLDRALDSFGTTHKIYLVETNGLPNLSDGNTPDIRSLGFGEWALELFNALSIDKACIAGASFGGLICMKACLVFPERIKAAFLLNPGCVQPFSMSFKNLYYNLLPIISPKEKNVRAFLDNAIFCKPHQKLSPTAEQLLIDYEVFALTRYKDNTQKPYNMAAELQGVTVPTYLIEGDKDLLFPYETSIKNARLHIKTLKDVKVFEKVAHGIETYAPALGYVAGKMGEYV